LPDHDKCQQHAAALLGISVVTSSIMLVVLHVLSVPQEFFHCVRRVAEDRMGRHATTRSPRPEGPTAQRESDRSSWNGIKRSNCGCEGGGSNNGEGHPPVSGLPRFAIAFVQY
jgi:hypothetical protein